MIMRGGWLVYWGLWSLLLTAVITSQCTGQRCDCLDLLWHDSDDPDDSDYSSDDYYLRIIFIRGLRKSKAHASPFRATHAK